MKRKIKIDSVYGKWTVIEEASPRVMAGGRKHPRHLCMCECGTKRVVDDNAILYGNSKSCGCTRKTTNAHLKRKVNKKRYITVHEPENENSDENGYAAEHRLVMSEYIGRTLSANEVVHHVNGNKHDNRLDNLVLFKNRKEHSDFHDSAKIKKTLDT